MKIFALLLSLILTVPAFAAREFNGSTDKITAASAVVTAAPLTFCALFNSDSVTTNQVAIGVSNNGTATDHFILFLRETTGDPVSAFTASAAGSGLANSTTGRTIDTWHHGCATEASSTSRAAFIDGGSKGTNATDRTPAGLNTTAIGVRVRTTDDQFLDGEVAEAAIWNRVLSDGEVATLGQRYSPNCLLNGLVNHTPLINEVQDRAKALAWSTTGTTATPHPRVFYCF